MCAIKTLRVPRFNSSPLPLPLPLPSISTLPLPHPLPLIPLFVSCSQCCNAAKPLTSPPLAVRTLERYPRLLIKGLTPLDFYGAAGAAAVQADIAAEEAEDWEHLHGHLGTWVAHWGEGGRRRGGGPLGEGGRWGRADVG